MRLPSIDGHRSPRPEFMLSARRSGFHPAGSCREVHPRPRDWPRRHGAASNSVGSAKSRGFGIGPWSKRAAPCGIISVTLLYLPDLNPRDLPHAVLLFDKGITPSVATLRKEPPPEIAIVQKLIANDGILREGQFRWDVTWPLRELPDAQRIAQGWAPRNHPAALPTQ